MSHYLKKKETLSSLIRGKHIIVATCGPSLCKHLKSGEINKSLFSHKQYIIACVKQAVDLVPGCDLHFVNSANAKKYNYGAKSPFIILNEDVEAAPTYMDYDLKTWVKRPANRDLKKTLAGTKDFSLMHIGSWDHPSAWGPGIMYESVIPTLMRYRAKKITVIGWDVAFNQEAKEHLHFYDLKRKDAVADVEAIKKLKVIPKKTALKFINIVPPKYKNLFLHRFGLVYNKSKPGAGENELVRKSIPALKAHCAKKNTLLEVI